MLTANDVDVATRFRVQAYSNCMEMLTSHQVAEGHNKDVPFDSYIGI